ncbi:hypothetical protein B0J11DRAFT_503242 [Dendryphion nanum]|uniref:Uncharacterized protein n=1 Tax=Dendryphion nanum TaxID=256645 RepID=A0A9P9E6Y8_9PLEO|nr:hypothetical protein B0J11DRAFT_503242 [Dendryphion nanum]
MWLCWTGFRGWSTAWARGACLRDGTTLCHGQDATTTQEHPNEQWNGGLGGGRGNKRIMNSPVDVEGSRAAQRRSLTLGLPRSSKSPKGLGGGGTKRRATAERARTRRAGYDESTVASDGGGDPKFTVPRQGKKDVKEEKGNSTWTDTEKAGVWCAGPIPHVGVCSVCSSAQCVGKQGSSAPGACAGVERVVPPTCRLAEEGPQSLLPFLEAPLIRDGGDETRKVGPALPVEWWCSASV